MIPAPKKKKKTDNKVHHLDYISSLSHYFEEGKKKLDAYLEQDPRLEVLGE